jgi:hypothetical protein
MPLHTLLITAKQDLGGGNTAVNTYHFHPDSGSAWAGSDRVAAANSLIGHLKTFYTALGTHGLSGAFTIGSVVLELERDEPPIYIGATPQTSTASYGPLVPYQCAMVVTWRTALAGKSYRGRSYLGPMLNSARADTQWIGSNVSQVNADVAAFLANVAGTAWDLCIASEVKNSSESVITGGATTAIRTMRSRAN